VLVLSRFVFAFVLLWHLSNKKAPPFSLGKTWSNGTLHPEMADPGCKGGIVRGAGGVLFAVGADSESLRVHDSIWASVDGITFPHKLRVDSSGGYSTVQITKSGRVASVYEYAGGVWNTSVAEPGGCHIRIATADPAAIVCAPAMTDDNYGGGGKSAAGVATLSDTLLNTTNQDAVPESSKVVLHPGIPNAVNASVGCFQIPVLLQLPGTNSDNLTLMAIAEARMQSSCYKLGETTIASRRSTDGGRTWDGLVFLGPKGDLGKGVWTKGKEWNTPAAMYNSQTRTVFLYFSNVSLVGTGPPYHTPYGELWCGALQRRSNDFGRTFGPVEEVGKPSWWKPDGSWQGPMHVGGQFDTDTGLMLTVPPNTGHMLIWGTFAAAAVKGGPDQASVLFTSTNGGSSYNTSTDFRCGLPAEGKSCGEQEWVELRNGTILALIRSNNRHKMAALSSDAGHTWYGHRDIQEISEPAGGVEGTLLRAPDGRLLFMGAASDDNTAGSRRNLTLWGSSDEGAFWSKPKLVMNGYAWYGGMVAGLDGAQDLGFLWSTGPGPPDSADNSVVFDRVSSDLTKFVSATTTDRRIIPLKMDDDDDKKQYFDRDSRLPKKSDKTQSVAQVVPYFNQAIVFVEAENLTTVDGWEARAWSATPNYFASNVNNVFHSRRAYLHAAAAATTDSVATTVLPVPTAGTYSVLLRYECTYRFETPVQISITQNGAEVFRHVYGRLSSLKVWPDSVLPLLPMVVPISGATENMVWEGIGQNVTLEAGSAVLTLRVFREPSVPLNMHADRNLDVIMLHPNASDVSMRLSSGKDRPLPLDGLLSQHGDVFFKVRNYNSDAITVMLSQGYAHSPYLDRHLKFFSTSPKPNTTIVQNRTWGSCSYWGKGGACDSIVVAPRTISEWHEVGQYLDTLNHGTWLIDVRYAAITVGIRSANGSIVPIARFPDEGEHKGGDMFMLFDASTRAFGRMRKPLDDFDEVMRVLDNQTVRSPPHGHPPVRTTIFAQTFEDPPTTYPGATEITLANASHAAYSTKRQRFLEMFGFSSAPPRCTNTSCIMMGLRPDKLDFNLTEVETQLQQVLATGVDPTGVRFVSLGDEVTLECPSSPQQANPCNLSGAAFEDWALSRNLSLNTIGCERWTTCLCSLPTSAACLAAPRLYYYSNLFLHDSVIKMYREIVRIVKSYLPNAVVGANFSPSVHFLDPHTGEKQMHKYIGSTYQFVRAFREGGLTLGWSEDWAFQSPLGSQQMTQLMVDALRSGLRHAADSHSLADGKAPKKQAIPLMMCKC
jgi:hypothetical protein